MTCADSVDVTAMNVMRRMAAAPPFPAIAMAAYGRTSPLLTSVDVMRWYPVSWALRISGATYPWVGWEDGVVL